MRLSVKTCKWILTACAAGALLLTGCADGRDAGQALEPYVAQAAPTAEPLLAALDEPSPTPTLAPEMLIEDDGDIILREDLAAAFETQTYAFDHAPRVLIYHTHATEAFLKGEADAYAETETGRTKDADYNILALGQTLKAALEQRGFIVLHDTTNVEPPELRSAYSRSLAVMQQYEDIDIYIDLHRNSSSKPGPSENTVTVEEERCAKFFFVVGTGIGTYEGEYDAAPDWERNYAFALSVMEAVEPAAAALVKPIRLKVGRYNQHMGLCLLAEIGTNRDTLAAAKNTAPYFADALRAVCEFPEE